MGGMIYDSNPVQAACIALVMHPDRGPTHSKSLDTDTSIIGTVAAQDADHFDTCRLQMYVHIPGDRAIPAHVLTPL